MASRARKLVVEVRRDLDGKVYSRVLDQNVESPHGDLSRVDDKQRYVVIDRANHRQYDIETVLNRGRYLADLMGVEFSEDLTWPCSAAEGRKNCQCPRCAEQANERAGRK